MRFWFLIFFIILFTNGFAQNKFIERGNKFYSNGDYLNAIKEYNQSNKADLNIEVKKNIINAYRLTNQIEKAEDFLKSVCLETKDSIYSNYYIHLLIQKKDWQTLKELENLNISNVDLKKIKDEIAMLYADSSNYIVSPIPINSSNADMGLHPYKNGFVYSSSMEFHSGIERKHSWTNQPFLKLYYVSYNNDHFGEIIPFASEIKSKYNIGPIDFCNKEKEMWTTENYSSKENLSSEHKFKLKIVCYKFSNEKWTKQKDFKFNNNNYNIAHPAISEDGNTLYFSSDMPGGYGGMDLYVTHKTKKGWESPKNLGPQINTSGNEVFPTLLDDGTLYFSSDGLVGLGGLDLFYTKYSSIEFLKPINIGAPLNSIHDDFHLCFDNKKQSGYISSNRKEGGLNDDIYKFLKVKESKIKQEENSTAKVELNSDTAEAIKRYITVKDESGNKIKGVTVFDKSNNKIAQSDELGTIAIDSSLESVILQKEGYFKKEIIFNEYKSEIEIKLKESSSIAFSDWYKIIYFDLDKIDVRKDMMNAMQEAVSFLKAHPEIKVTITSYTDSRASKTYNEKLSQRRSESIANYLLVHGISKKQILKTAWKGEGILVNNCGDETPCTEQMHQLNRRTEIFVSGLSK